MSLRESVELIADPRNLDAGVEEVFQTMMGGTCLREKDLAMPYTPESVTAVVGFGGLFSGACVLRSSAETAQLLAERMTGMEFAEVDDTVRDAFGEICNMLAGAWKSRVPKLAGHCGLSVPAVITGRDYNIHVQTPEFRVHHFFSFDDARFDVTIICDGLR
ncbi:chemotaxis protein CheX [Terracidiphilus sp.]|uniref:chemotaxis protein CheX n=1 Tax=Terracidiphilus sp. TaxID=1964191 RepID=UPI003C25003B